MTDLTIDQKNDVTEAAESLRGAIRHWDNARGRCGKMVADEIKHHRDPAIELQSFVRASREFGFNIMPTLRAEFGKAPQIKGRKTIYSREERTRARMVLDIARKNS